MIRRYRLRRLLAPTRGFRQAILFFLLGQVALLLGIGLSFRGLLRPVFVWLSQTTQSGIAAFVPEEQVSIAAHYLGGLLLVLGLFASWRGLRTAINHFVDTLNPGMKAGKVDLYLRRQQLAQGPRIVCIGGGTGLSTLLRGLKQHSSNITAIVTVSDDGGSSGRLIREKGMIPPGDLRNCLVALADAEKAMTDLFQHRFRDDSGSLSGHSTGNLLLAALADQAHGDFDRVIEIAASVLAIRGQVVPSTLDHIRLRAILNDGTEVCGETNIAAANRPITELHLDPADCTPHPKALEAIRTADLIVVGPGSVYTSIIPNLLVPGIAEAIERSKAPKVYVCNVMTQPGESEGFTASRHALSIVNTVRNRVFDYVMVNTEMPNSKLLAKYQGSGQHLVEPDIDLIKKYGFRPVPGDYMSATDVVRHDPAKVSAMLMRLLDRGAPR